MFTDVLLHFPFDGAPSRSFPVVENVFTFGQRDLTLDQVVLQVDACGDKREAPFLRAPGEFIDFPSVQEQAPIP
jgi:hypothetical protein